MQPETLNHREVRIALEKKINPVKAEFYPRFFKTGKGEYGEGDQFLGVVVPEQRKIARSFKTLPLKELKTLLHDPFHECRLTAIYILVLQYQKAKEPDEKARLCRFYLDNLEGVNNWDLVDSSAPKILGPEVHRTGDATVLRELAASGELWKERIAVISTYELIRQGQYEPTEELAEKFLSHPHDLMHKACGWMLREVGKRDLERLRGFLSKHASEMPRTMLRYSLEKLDKEERQRWMSA